MNSYVFRQGKMVPTDEAFEALGSADLPRMLRAMQVKTNPVDRHFLLQGIVDWTYKQRTDPEMRRILYTAAGTHLIELPTLAKTLREEFRDVLGGALPSITTFEKYMRTLCEDGDFVTADGVCEIARTLGIELEELLAGMKRRVMGKRKRTTET